MVGGPIDHVACSVGGAHVSAERRAVPADSANLGQRDLGTGRVLVVMDAHPRAFEGEAQR